MFNKMKVFVFSFCMSIFLILPACSTVPTQTIAPTATASAQKAQSRMDQVASALNMSVNDLDSALKGGKTIADLAKSKGLETAALIDTLTASSKANLAQAVQEKKLTQEQADQRLNVLKKNLNDWFITGAYPLEFQQTSILRQAAKTAAETLGMSLQDLQAAEKSGKTIAGLVQEKGMTLESLVSKIAQNKTQTLQKSVQDGKMSQAQADMALKNFKEGISQWCQTGKTPSNWKQADISQEERIIVAKALAITTRDLAEATKNGKTVSQLAQEKGVSLDSIINDLAAVRSTTLQKMVQNGKLTQSQADQNLTRFKESLKRRFTNIKSTRTPPSSATPQPTIIPTNLGTSSS